jgi:hypothetical protein
MNSTTTAEKAYYSTQDLEARWGVSRWTIHRLAKDGRLKKSRIRGAVRYSAATVMSFERKS